MLPFVRLSAEDRIKQEMNKRKNGFTTLEEELEACKEGALQKKYAPKTYPGFWASVVIGMGFMLGATIIHLFFRILTGGAVSGLVFF